eukprot:786242-Alexandrium_andersonii.AAC.1
MIKRWSTTQKTIALSSGMAELAGIVQGSAEGAGLVSVARGRGVEAGVRVRADSSAAVGMCCRS